MYNLSATKGPPRWLRLQATLEVTQGQLLSRSPGAIESLLSQLTYRVGWHLWDLPLGCLQGGAAGDGALQAEGVGGW